MNAIKKRTFSIIKSAVIALIAASALYIAFAVPEAVQGMVPAVQVVSAESCEYCPAVTAKGAVVKQEDRWFAVVAVGEGDISLIEIGQTARLSGAALKDGEFSGTVVGIGDSAYSLAVSASALPETVVDVTVEIESGNVSELKSGYSVTAQLITGENRILTTLPYTAISQDDKGEYIYVLENGISVRRDIVTGIELSDRTEVVSGIKKGDRVITYPEDLAENSYCRIR